MAHICCRQSDLRKALLEVPRLSVGVKSVSDMLKINILNWPPTGLFILLSQMLGFTDNMEKGIAKWAERIEGNILKLHPPFQFDEVLLSGSWSEGLNLHQIHESVESQLSDMDFMCILKNISFSEEDQTCGNLTVREDTPFVHAYITEEESLKMWKDLLEDGSKNRLSSWKLKKMLHENYKKNAGLFDGLFDEASEKCKDIGEGPSLKVSKQQLNCDNSNPFNVFENALIKVSRISISSSDIVLSIRCDGWPRNAWEWIERERVWPDKDLVENICENGFHIVPKSSPKGDFRLSFSVAETTLIENLTPLQHKVLRAFKAIIKYYQSNWSPNIKDMICTYHLKTIAFWHFEKSTQDSWTEDNVVSHLLSLLNEFAQALREGNLPMYFLPKYNLFGKVEDIEEMRKISGKVVELSRDLPAITKAVNEVAYVKLGDVWFKEIVSAVIEYTDREEDKKAAKESSAVSGNEPRTEDEPIVKNYFGLEIMAFAEQPDVVEIAEEWENAVEVVKVISDGLFFCLDSQPEKEN